MLHPGEVGVALGWGTVLPAPVIDEPLRSPNAQETTFTAWLFAGLSRLDPAVLGTPLGKTRPTPTVR